MGRHDDFDGQMDGQLTIEDMFSPPERMVAVSNIFARARKQMSLAEQKTFVLALSKLEWTKAPGEQSNVVRLDIKVLAKALGYKSDSSDISQHIWDAVKHLAPNSYIEIADTDTGFFTSGSVVATITKRRGTDYIRVKFEEDYFPLFTGLGSKYITLWSSDIFGMSSKRSVQFYELLRQMSFDRYEVGRNVYSYGWGIKAFKEMFDIPKEGKGSYMRDKDGFDRANFERYVIDPLCEDLMKTKMIQLVVQPDGKLYEKVKNGNRVQGYRFYWTYSAHPAVATAPEVKAITERVDKDPQVLKVAKDVVAGKGKPKRKKSQKPAFKNFEQRSYDWGELEGMLLNQSMESIEKGNEDDKRE